MSDAGQIQKELKSLEKQLDAFITKSSVTDAEMRNDIMHIKTGILELKALVSDKYVSRLEFEPIKKLVYGTASVILTSVIGGMMALIIIR
jgi:hypothetical protein